jgi:hypothetical protein
VGAVLNVTSDHLGLGGVDSLDGLARVKRVIAEVTRGTVVLNAEVGGGGAAGMAGNVFVGGIIGAGIDAGTGAMYEHKPNPLMVILEKE